MRATSCTRFALISGPIRVAEAVRMMRPENVSRKSTSPSSAHSVAKYASASEMILGTIASSDLGGDQRVGRRSPRGEVS